MLAQIDRATDAVVAVPGVADMFRGLRRLPDPEEAARDEARRLARENSRLSERIAQLEAEKATAQGEGEVARGEARRHARVSRGYRNGLVFWFLTTGVLAVGSVAEYLIMRGG